MSVEAYHLVSSSRRGVDFCVNQNRLKPGSVLPLGRLLPSIAIVTCDVENNNGAIIVQDPNRIVIEIHQSEADKVGIIIDTKGLPVVIVSFSDKQWVALYKRQKHVRRKIELLHVGDDSEIDDNRPLVDDRMSL